MHAVLQTSIKYDQIEAAHLLLSCEAKIDEEWIKKERQEDKDPEMYKNTLLVITQHKEQSNEFLEKHNLLQGVFYN